MRAFVEMTAGTGYKIEQAKGTSAYIIDRCLPVKVPHNYGYIFGTYAQDGDALDVFLYGWESLPTGVSTEIDVIGIIYGLDQNVSDDKILAYVKGDVQQDYDTYVQECVNYLKTYKEGYEVVGIGDAIEADAVIRMTRAAYEADV